MPTIREYDITYTSGNDYAEVRVSSAKRSNAYFSKVPTEKEVNELLGTQDKVLSIPYLFDGCSNLAGSPRLPELARLQNASANDGLFYGCSKLKIAPMLTREFYGTTKSLRASFRNCTALIHAPVIPPGVVYLNNMFRGATALVTPSSIPNSVTTLSYMFDGCTALKGEMVICGNPTSYSYMFQNTTKQITLYGDKTKCEALAATGNNGNVSWSAWYDPVPAVTNRGQGSKTTAADMTRMVRNGALAVSTYAPGRMVYQQGDIVREDEWIALVEAAKTIDPTVTLSTHYSNLNKIEAAFESAL